MEDSIKFAIYLFVLVYSCILHECAHVWVAWRLGDPTGKQMGRLTLNPVPHIDLFWTILLPAMTWFTHVGAIGGPKPAPVNPLNFKNPRSGHMWTALAGPASNLLLVILGLLLLLLFFHLAPGFVLVKERDAFGDDSYQVTWLALFLTSVMFTNIMLAAFNLLPVPPLDGSRFLRFILGRSNEDKIDAIERLGIIPLLIASYYLAPHIIRPFAMLLVTVLAHLFPREYARTLVEAYFSR